MDKLVTSNATGTVTTYNSGEGYGFVTTVDVPSGVGRDVDAFFHISDVSSSVVKEGWRFEFDLRKTSKGYRVDNASVISKDTSQDIINEQRRHGLNKDEDLPDQWEKNHIREEFVSGKSDEDDDEEESEGSSNNPFRNDRVGSMNDELNKR